MSERDLTAGEIALARKLYRQSIDYSEVKVHHGKYIFFQPDNSGMTPNGEIYMAGPAYRKDYSVERGSAKAFFLHEMAHVWQYQLNVLNPITAAIGESVSHFFDYQKAYEYTLQKEKDLLDYEIEQQAAIIEDYYRLHIEGIRPVPGHMQNNLSDVRKNNLFRAVLSRFIKDPNYPRHSVACTGSRHRGGRRRVTTCRRVPVQ